MLGLRWTHRILGACALAVVACGDHRAPGSGTAVAIQTQQARGATPADAVTWDVSPPLTSLTPAARPSGHRVKEHRALAVPPGAPDTVVQSSPGAAAAPVAGAGFEGVGQGFTGPQGTFTVNSAPPDPNADVGPNHVVQIVNTDFAVFNKTGTVLYGPVPTNTLWSGFGGGCQANNDGDAVVQYDQLADRWILTQFSVATTPFLQCVAVSTTGDPTGTYARYAFSYSNFPDYPKLSVWPDAYYITFNMFSGSRFVGAQACAYDRGKMLAGQAATQQCFTLSSFGGLLPSDLDGATLPPSGSPSFVMNFGSSSLNLWKFHVDWTTPANSTLSGPTNIPVAGFTTACGGGSCIPQLGTSQQLDSLGDRLMYRLAYRNFGDHEAIVVNHSVATGGSTGVRWYEVRSPNATPTVFQQGTYAPDASYRWMGSIAMNKNGDMGLGFSVSSGSLHPEIHYTGRLAADALGTMTQGEASLIDGTGSQLSNLNRWGDYTSMAVDPTDDCTFWYTNQYLATNGTFNWQTRIGSFKLSSCATSPDFSLSATPSSSSVVQGNTATYTVTDTPSGGFTGAVTLSVSGLPSGAVGSFAPNPTTSTSTLSITTATTTPAGSYPLTITGTSGTLTHTTSATLVVTAPASPDFSLSVNPTSASIVRGQQAAYTVTVSPSGGFSSPVTLSASGLDPTMTASFAPNPTTSTSTLTVSTTTSTPRGTFTITITGVSGSLTHTTSASLTVRRR